MAANGQARALKGAELRRLAQMYHLEGYLFGTVSPRFVAKGTLSAYDFYSIVTWKSNRAKKRIRAGMAAAGKSPGALMQEVSAATTLEAKVETLLAVEGFGLPMASAILSVCYPDRFTLLNGRSWQGIVEMAPDNLPARRPMTAAEYVQYCAACVDLAKRLGLLLRDLDRALWARSWEDDLHALVDGQRSEDAEGMTNTERKTARGSPWVP